ncbi:TetR/AcrR family transcriptional regulator [Amycolatopsis sp. cg5]|uniref:TetR/AcrR family transcriptional regulator n=1 Tax=Amycolatopsis sp. cg5 TaxID=3238802 RepID=UPI003524958E
MNARTAILEAAADLLATSPIADVSTRAVCEAAGVGAPTLYRHFGDKEGLLTAVVDHGFEQYLASKRSAKPSADPVRDLRDGWDNHVDFAVKHPSYYRLMHSPSVTSTPAAAVEAHGLLLAAVERVAAAGRLRVPPPVAAEMIMTANIGVALMLVSRPEMYDRETSVKVRDAVHHAVLTAQDTVDGQDTETAAVQLAARLRQRPDTRLSPGETALLHELLNRLSTKH